MLLAVGDVYAYVLGVREKSTGNREQKPRSAAREMADEPADESRRVLPFKG